MVAMTLSSQTNPIHEYTSKYAGKGGRGLPVRRIAKVWDYMCFFPACLKLSSLSVHSQLSLKPCCLQIGRQIIEALEFLYSRGLKYQHLHAGNVIMDNGVPKLTGYTNWLFGYQSRLYPSLK
jgi:hypothetical protein